MKKTLLFFIGLILSGNLLYAQGAGAQDASDQIEGTWLTDTKDSKIEIFKSGASYSGRLLWANEMFEADGKTSKKDVRNPDAKLRDRILQNLIIITNLAYSNGAWEDGKIYDPDSGKTYSCTLKVKDGKLMVRAYMGISFLGKTFAWERVK